MTDDEIVADMRRIVEAQKNAGEPVGWHYGRGRSASLILSLPLNILEDTIGTGRLVLRAVQGRADRDCSATLIATIGGRDLHVWRMDWRPANPHTNRCGPSSLKGLTSSTGIHDFACNAALGLGRMQVENLPLCVPIDVEPHDFDAFVRYACSRLNITPLEPVPGPPWSSTLPF